MAINLQLVKSKLAALQTANQKSEKSEAVWKPEPGSQVIRIVPYQHNKENPFIELYMYYDFGKAMVSPSTVGKADPVLEFAEKLRSSGKKEDWVLSKKIEPKHRVYVPVIVRGKENEGVKFWGFGKTVFQELLAVIDDPDYGDITDVASGRDITVEFKTKEQTGKDFPETSIRVKPNQTPVTNSKEVVELISNQKNLLDIFKVPTYEELHSAFTNWINKTSDETAGTETTTVPDNVVPSTPKAAKPAKPTTSAPATAVSDVAAAFDSLFNAK